MKVVAIVVAYNSARDLPMSLSSLAALPIEATVVVDNASSDTSAQVARRYTSTVVTASNLGFGRAVNLGAAEAPDADAYLLMNPDCRISADDYAVLVDALRVNQDLGAVAPIMRYPDGRYGISAGPEPGMAKEWLAALRVDHLVPERAKEFLRRSDRVRRRIPMAGYLMTEPSPGTRAVAWVSGFCMLVRARAFRQVNGFDPDYFLYFEDVDICRRLRGRGWTVASVGDSVAEHEESTSTSAVGKTPLYRSGMAVYFAKHGTRGQRLAARVLKGLPL